MIHEIVKWFQAAKAEPTTIDAAVQIGVHIEEVSEMFAPLGLLHNQTQLEVLASRMKDNPDVFADTLQHLTTAERVELLDALCDQIVTAIGVAHRLNMDIVGALAEVNRSNFSKFEHGQPVFNAQGKIAKGKDYTPPILEPFV